MIDVFLTRLATMAHRAMLARANRACAAADLRLIEVTRSGKSATPPWLAAALGSLRSGPPSALILLVRSGADDYDGYVLVRLGEFERLVAVGGDLR